MVDNLKLFNIKESAQVLKVSERQLFRYIKAKKVKVIYLSPKTLRIEEQDLKDFIKKNKK